MIKNIIQEEIIEEVRQLLASYQRFVIVAHISPDGDAVGASQGICHYLHSLKKEAVVIYSDSVSENLNWLAGVNCSMDYELMPEACDETIARAEVIFCVDFNAAKRMGKMSDSILASSALKIMIDHHLYPESFCNIIISHPEISSSSELVFRLIHQLGDARLINLDASTAIYTGMMTDTGGFTYNSNSPDIYVIISELLKIGVNKDRIYDRVCNTFSESRERLMGYTISQKMKVYPANKAAMISLTAKELEAYHFKKGDSEGFVNIPLAVKGVVFSAFFREDKEYIKVSLRSKGDFPANKVAEKYFNGGGHKNASGGEFFGSMEEAIALFESVLPEFACYLP